MPARLQSLSTEVLYEIFDYLPTYDLFHVFINLNDRFKQIVGSYPLQLDFRGLSRTKFDFICFHLRPEQVVSLILSEKHIPEQVTIFRRYFPHFQSQFIHLRRLHFLKTEDILSDLPSSVSALTFQSLDWICLMSERIIDTIVKQASSLTYLKVDSLEFVQAIHTSLPLLTHLSISTRVLYSSKCKSSLVAIPCLMGNFRSPITDLSLMICNDILKSHPSLLKLDYLPYCLTSFTLACGLDENCFSMEFLQHHLSPLRNLKKLTLNLVCQLDLLDGKKWEKFLRQTSITQFHFHFTLSSKNVNFNQNESVLLHSFRSPFWLEEKHCYVAYDEELYQGRIVRRTIYSIPRFLSQFVDYNKDRYPPISTVPSSSEQRIFYSRHIQSLSLDFNESITQPLYRFTHIQRLELAGPSLPSIDLLLSIVDLNQIKELDVSKIKNISIGGVYVLLQSMTCLNHLIFEHFIPLFIPPSHVYSFTINKWRSVDDFDVFCRMFAHVKSLDIDSRSNEMIVARIKRLKHLEHVIFRHKFEQNPACWIIGPLKRKVWHLRNKNWTYLEEDYYVVLSIGKKQKRNNHQLLF